ncbi:MAG: biotin/lipoyl-binding protein, partial [Sulfurihydrogenibium azorense]
MVKKAVIFGIVLALILLGLFFYKKNNSYQTYKVEKRQVVKSVYASGYIDTSDLVVVKSEVSGYVEKMYVKEGDTVKKGQPIA